MKRNKKTVIATIVFVAVFAIAVVIICSATGVFDKNDHNTWYEEARNGGIGDEMVEKITVGMTFSEVVDIIGKPQRDTGSGVWIMEWDMKSGKVLAVCFNPVTDAKAKGSSNADYERSDLISYHIEVKNKN